MSRLRQQLEEMQRDPAFQEGWEEAERILWIRQWFDADRASRISAPRTSAYNADDAIEELLGFVEGGPSECEAMPPVNGFDACCMRKKGHVGDHYVALEDGRMFWNGKDTNA